MPTGSMGFPGWESTAGENSRVARLSDDQVRQIRVEFRERSEGLKRHEQRELREAIAEEFGISVGYLGDLIARRKR
ncbi:MAG: hypothetical protein AAFU85_25580, partial [Planctomycetota bacterium]